MSTLQPVTILLVEDDPGHARLIEKHLRRALISNDLRVFSDGQAVVDYLFLAPGNTAIDLAAPLLILLDLSLPVLDGYRVLERVKRNVHTQHIPIIILTAMDEPEDIDRCYALGCSIYITKPVEMEEFVEAIGNLDLFLSVVSTPLGVGQTTTC